MSSPNPRAGRRLAFAALGLLALAGCTSVPERPSVPPDVEARQYLTSGLLAAQSGKHELALSEYVKGLAAEPKNPDLHYQAAVSQLALGKVSAAALAYRRVLSLQPNHAGALEGLGLLMLRQTQYDSARQLLNRSVAENPGAWRSLNGLGMMADLQQEYTAAQEYYSKALAVNPSSAMLTNNLGYSKYLSGRYDDARVQFERAIAIDAQYAQAWTNLGLVFARKGRYNDAMRAFAQSMSEAEAAYSTGYVCLLDNRLKDAEAMFRRAIDLSPSYYAEAQEGLAKAKSLRYEQGGAAR